MEFMSRETDWVRVARRITDGGTLSSSYDAENHHVFLTACGGMTDSIALGEIGEILHDRVKAQTHAVILGRMSVHCVRVPSAEAHGSLASTQGELPS